MTMLRAQLLLWTAVLAAVFAGWFVLRNVDLELDNPQAPRQPGGAALGENPAVRPGGDAPRTGEIPSVGSALATLTASLQTAFASPAGTPVRGTPTAPPAASARQPIEVDGARYTVQQLVDPEAPGFFATTPGRRRVAVEVSVEALSAPVDYDFTRFRIAVDNGGSVAWTVSNTKPEFDRGTLQPGETYRGWLAFQVPVDQQTTGLLLSRPAGGPRVLLAEFDP